jgi:hypothetical protein
MDAIEKIFLEAVELPRRDRVALARRLMRSAKDEVSPGLAAELERRSEE